MIVFEKVTKRFSSGGGIEDLSFEVPNGKTLVLLGRSGSGKTTVLRLINRLIEPAKGKIIVNGKNIRTMDPIELRRSIGYAVQGSGLFPHMTVEANMSIVPQLLGWSEVRIKERLEELYKMIGMDAKEYRHRFPIQLSGGQHQRVGVARALAADPPLILMDEPFGALDPITRYDLQAELLAINAKIHKTIIFVTHDVIEALRLGDLIGVIEMGRLVQLDTPENLMKNPASLLVEQLIGKSLKVKL